MSIHPTRGAVRRRDVGARSLPHHAENRRLVEQACVELERDLKAFLLGMLRDVHHTDDVFQKTVLKAISAAEAVVPETVRGWLFQIALNEVRELKRKDARSVRLRRSVWEATQAHRDCVQEYAWLQATSGEEKAVIENALSRLSEEYRNVVVRRIQHGQTFAEISEEISKPLGTVLTWMRRALIELRNMQEVRQLLDE